MLTYLIVIPLVAGYFFANNWNVSKYSIKRSEGYRLYFDSALYGLLLLVLAVLSDSFLLHIFPSIKDIGYVVIRSIFPAIAEQKVLPFVSIGLLTLAYGLILPHMLNRLLTCLGRDSTSYLLKAVDEDDFENLLVRSCDRGLPICLTLESGKIYVGVLWSGMNPSIQRKDVSIIPLVSGYRRDTDKKMEITTYYQGIYDLMEDSESENLEGLSIEDFEKIIPVSQIVSANLFDFRAYTEFQNNSGS